MIKIKKPTVSKGKKKPYYKLVFNYMIGDADGETTETVTVDVDHPYVERFVKLLNKVKPVKGTWGIILDEETVDKFLKEKQITKSDHEFLKKLMFEGNGYGEDGSDDEDEVNEDERCYDFYDAIRSDAEYSFLVFQGIDLFYYDEKGVKHETVIK